MPYWKGKRISNSEWVKLQEPRRLVLYDRDGEVRTVVNQPEIDDWNAKHRPDVTTAEVLQRGREARSAAAAKAAIANALGVTLDSPELAGIDVTGGEYTTGGARIDPPAPEERPERPAEPESGAPYRPWLDGATEDDEDEPGPTTRAQEQRFAEAKGFESRRDRPSQTPLGRHHRYVKAQARKRGIEPADYDRRMANHPDGCEWQS